MAVEHDTTSETMPDENGPGGSWSVGCTCGWSRVGRYARPGGEPVALLLAGLHGGRARAEPDQGDGGRPVNGGPDDARGVEIRPGDTVVYGFGVGRSIAMAEARVETASDGTVSRTPSGRVWLRIVRRSYAAGTQDRVHVAPDRMTVVSALPPSPQFTQDEKYRDELTLSIRSLRVRIKELRSGVDVPDRYASREDAIIAWTGWLTEYRAKLDTVNDRIRDWG